MLDESEPVDDSEEYEQATSVQDANAGSNSDADSDLEQEYARLRNGGAQGNFDYYEVCCVQQLVFVLIRILVINGCFCICWKDGLLAC